MNLSFPDAMTRLKSGMDACCKHPVGSAWFLDDEEWHRLAQQFDEAVCEFTSVYGEPNSALPIFPGMDVEKAVCWLQSGKVLYVALSYEDNTRIRCLTLGLQNVGKMKFAEPDEQDWWAKQL